MAGAGVELSTTLADRGRRLGAEFAAFWRRVPELCRQDPTAVFTIAVNVFAVAWCVAKGFPLAMLVVVYAVETAVIALWNVPKMILVERGMGIFCSLTITPVTLLICRVCVIFAALLAWLEGFREPPSPELVAEAKTFLATAAVLFAASHGWSFFRHFVGGREWEGRDIEAQAQGPYLRAGALFFMVWLGALVGALTFGILAAWPLLVLKLTCDLSGHWLSHGYIEDTPFAPGARKPSPARS